MVTATQMNSILTRRNKGTESTFAIPSTSMDYSEYKTQVSVLLQLKSLPLSSKYTWYLVILKSSST